MNIKPKGQWKSIWQEDNGAEITNLYGKDITLEQYLESLPVEERAKAELAIRGFFKDIKSKMNEYANFNIALESLGTFQVRPMVVRSRIRQTISQIKKYNSENYVVHLKNLLNVRNQIAYILKYKKKNLATLIRSGELQIPIKDYQAVPVNPFNSYESYQAGRARVKASIDKSKQAKKDLHEAKFNSELP